MLKRRLGRLEARWAATASVEEKERGAEARREVLRLMTTEELREYEAALERFATDGRFAEADEPILLRVDELFTEQVSAFVAGAMKPQRKEPTKGATP